MIMRVARLRRLTGERPAAPARRDDVRAEVAEPVEAVVAEHRAEARVPAAGRVLEEHALDRVAGAVREHLVEGRVDQHGGESSQ